MNKKIKEMLLELGIVPNLKGFDYICYGLECLLKSNKKISMRVLYTDIAIKFDSTVMQTERCIRHAFSKLDKESESFKKYILCEGKTNSEMLYALKTYLELYKEQLEEELDENGN